VPAAVTASPASLAAERYYQSLPCYVVNVD
jgi:hypothetical protein